MKMKRALDAIAAFEKAADEDRADHFDVCDLLMLAKEGLQEAMAGHKYRLGEGVNAAQLIASAIKDLHEARDKLRVAQARKAHAYVNRALKSVEGAQRHARLAPYREARQAQSRRNVEDAPDPENVYGSDSMRQSIEEDRK